MEDTWEELEALCRELPASDEGETDARSQLKAQIEMLRPALEALDRHDSDLATEEALMLVRDRLLGGAAVIQRISFEYGLERLVTMMWPAALDPRPDLARAGGEYRIEVWLQMGEDARPRVRVIGARRMEATLPVAREKFRAVLLGAVRAPAYLEHAHEHGAPAPGSVSGPIEPPSETEAARTPEPPSEDAQANQDVAEPAGRPEAPGDAAEQPVSPSEDEPIPLGTATPNSPDAPDRKNFA